MKIIKLLKTIIIEATPSLPVDDGWISSEFGEKRDNKTHKAVDIAVESGTPIKSPLSGTIVADKDNEIATGFKNNDCGGTIVIKHDNGFTSSFCHVRKILFTKNGEKIKQDQVVGYSGGLSTDNGRGNSTKAHLHFVLRDVDGKKVDPRDHMDFSVYGEKPQTKNIIKNRETTIDDIIQNGDNSELIGSGSKGRGVKEVQDILTKLEYDIGEEGIDGLFGSNTKKGLEKYQKDRSLNLVDGIVGIETSTELVKDR